MWLAGELVGLSVSERAGMKIGGESADHFLSASTPPRISMISPVICD